MTEPSPVDPKDRRRILQMAFPLYLSYLTSEQKPAAACFVPQSGHPAARPTATAKTMEGAPVPVVPMDCYEDMFHEIAKKFYGEGALPVQGNENGAAPAQGGLTASATQGELGLMDLDYQQVAKDGHYQSGTSGPGTTAAGPTLIVQTTGGPVLQVTMEAAPNSSGDHTPSPSKKSKTKLKGGAKHTNKQNQQHHQQQQQQQQTPPESTWVESEDLLTWNSSKVASYNATHKLFRCLDCGCVGFLARIAEHWLGAHANLRVFQCPRCHYNSAWARCIRMHLARQHNEQNPDSSLWRENPVLEEVTKFLLNLKNRVESKDENPGSGDKRYTCPYCPYATDRRDLYTRHETIHSEEKPFQCYVCDKQFNRADHCKKHFSRMHRDHAYDLQKIKKAAGGDVNINHSPPKASTLVVAAAPPTQVPFYTAVAVQSGAAASITVPSQVQNQSVQAAVRPPTATYPHLGLPAFPSQPAPTQAYKSYTTLGVEALVRPSHVTTTIATPSSQSQQASSTASSASTSSSSGGGGGGAGAGAVGHSGEKKKKEKLYACTYCAWRGVDNWCLKRHLNTHIKPYLCVLCDYKAARSERLATHVHKVHNKRICSKCNFLADDQDALSQHMREHHQNSLAKSSQRPGKTTSRSGSMSASAENGIDGGSERDGATGQAGHESLCEFRTTDGSLIHIHVAERHDRDVHSILNSASMDSDSNGSDK